MACSACAERRRRQGNKVQTPRTPTKSSPNSAVSKGSNLRDKMRFTGR